MRGFSVGVTMKSLGIDQLSIADRIALVQEIWDSIAATPEEVPLTEAQKQEFDLRLVELETNPESVLTWQEIKVRVRDQR
jgi:putative addiction module component (TIGR02574 family)